MTTELTNEEVRAYAKRLLHVAHHEAAHVVVGWLVRDMPLIEVSIAPKHGHIGVTESVSIFDGLRTDEALLRERVDRAVVATLSGVYADFRLLGGNHNWSGSLEDIRLASRLAGYVVPRADLDGYLAGQHAAAKMIVADAWPQIDALAMELLNRTRMTGEEVREFLRRIGADVWTWYSRKDWAAA